MVIKYIIILNLPPLNPIQRWWCILPRLWSCRWRRKASKWRWASTSSSSVRLSPGLSGTPSPWPPPPRKTTSAPTSVLLGTGLRRCMRPVEETQTNLWRPGPCPSREDWQRRKTVFEIACDCIWLLPIQHSFERLAGGVLFTAPSGLLYMAATLPSYKERVERQKR